MAKKKNQDLRLIVALLETIGFWLKDDQNGDIAVLGKCVLVLAGELRKLA